MLVLSTFFSPCLFYFLRLFLPCFLFHSSLTDCFLNSFPISLVPTMLVPSILYMLPIYNLAHASFTHSPLNVRILSSTAAQVPNLALTPTNRITVYLLHCYPFEWISAKSVTCTVVSVFGTLAEANKLWHLPLNVRILSSTSVECAHFIFNKCPIYTHEGASGRGHIGRGRIDIAPKKIVSSYIVLQKFILQILLYCRGWPNSPQPQ